MEVFAHNLMILTLLIIVALSIFSLWLDNKCNWLLKVMKRLTDDPTVPNYRMLFDTSMDCYTFYKETHKCTIRSIYFFIGILAVAAFFT